MLLAVSPESRKWIRQLQEFLAGVAKRKMETTLRVYGGFIRSLKGTGARILPQVIPKLLPVLWKAGSSPSPLLKQRYGQMFSANGVDGFLSALRGRLDSERGRFLHT